MVLPFSLVIAALGACSLYGAWDLLRLLSVDLLSLSELIAPENWEAVQDYLEWMAEQGVTGPPSVDTQTMSALGAGDKWYGGVLASDGRIYGVP